MFELEFNPAHNSPLQPAAFTVLFAVPRTIGWLSHDDEMMAGEFKITRPAQVYIGSGERPVSADRG